MFIIYLKNVLRRVGRTEQKWGGRNAREIGIFDARRIWRIGRANIGRAHSKGETERHSVRRTDTAQPRDVRGEQQLATERHATVK